MDSSYIPNRGDIVWIDMMPQAGHEQSGRRPAIVLSPVSYNETVGLGLFCPITSRRKGRAFEVDIPAGLEVSGVILSDQVRSLDWKVRRAEFLCEVPAATVFDVLAKLDTLLR